MVGKTVFAMTTYVQKLTANNLFSDLKNVEWVSQIESSKFGKAEIRHVSQHR